MRYLAHAVCVLFLLAGDVSAQSAPCPCGSSCKCADSGKCPGCCPATLRIVKRPVWLTDYDAAARETTATGRPLFVLFTDPERCMPCRKLEAGALSDPSVRDVLAGFVCCRVEVRSPTGSAILRRFAAHGDPVNSWPTLKVYRGGIRVADRTGDVPADVLLGLIR